jgi:predicted DNA-binding protein
MPPVGPRISSKTPLPLCEERAVSFRLPIPITERLDDLVEEMTRLDHRAYRKDLLAALALAAPEEPETLIQLVEDYRTATAGEAAVAEEAAGEVIEFKRRAPGPRPRPS